MKRCFMIFWLAAMSAAGLVPSPQRALAQIDSSYVRTIGVSSGSCTMVTHYSLNGNNYAAVGLGTIFKIIDVNDPNSPGGMAWITLPSAIKDIAVYGIYAFVADNNSGLYIINISNPAYLTQVSHININGYAKGVAVSGNYAYVATTYGLSIISISNPANPTQIGSYHGSWVAYGGIAVSGNYVYIAAGENGLRIINVGNPATPTEVGFYDMPGTALELYVSGSYAYVADGSHGLRIINISDPTSPTEVGYYLISGSSFNDVFVSGNYAYVAENSYGLVIINVSDPANPVPVSFFHTPESAIKIAIAGNYAFLAAYCSMHIINISNPTSPSEASHYNCIDFLRNIAVVGDRAYVTSRHYLYVFDISLPNCPTLMGFAPYEFDINQIYVSPGFYAYIAAGSSGLKILDVIDPSDMPVIGTFNTPGMAYGVSKYGNYAYVADGDSGLRVIDVTNPVSPTQAGFYDSPGFARDIAINNSSYAYLADGAFGLRIISIANPTAPVEINHYDTPGNAINVTYASNIGCNQVYVADYDTLRIIDVSDPYNNNPTELGSYPGYVIASAVDNTLNNNYIYLVNSYSLKIINRMNVSTPTLSGFYYFTGYAENLAVSNGYIYVPAGECGLRIYQGYGPAGVEEGSSASSPGPSSVRLASISPNPMNASATIEYQLDNTGQVNLSIYNAAGQLVATLVNEVRSPGKHQAQWNGRDGYGNQVSSGVYFIKLTTVSGTAAKRIMVLK